MGNNSYWEELSSCQTALFERHLSSSLVELLSDFTKFVQSFNANYVSHVLNTRQLQGTSPPDPLTRALPLDPTEDKAPRPHKRLALPRSPWVWGYSPPPANKKS